MSAAAQLMAIVLNNGKVTGILTDRDIVVRLVAAGKGADTQIADIASDADPVKVTADTAL